MMMVHKGCVAKIEAAGVKARDWVSLLLSLCPNPTPLSGALQKG